MNISLPDEMKNWVEENVQTGRYSNVSDYVRDLIRDDHRRLADLRTALIEGENSEQSSELDFEAFIAAKKKSLSLCAKLYSPLKPNLT
jgi:antitoxin ParD1/3/4